MARTTIKFQSGKSPERFANKRTLTSSEARWLRGFERRLLNACAFHLSNPRKSLKFSPEALLLNKFLKLRLDIENVMSELKGTKIGPDVVAHQLENPGFATLDRVAKRRLETLASVPATFGRPSVVKGDIALLLCVGLGHAKQSKRRILANEIGRLISENGPIHQRLQAKFGKEAFYSLCFPTVNPREERWERSSKASLMKEAKAYVLRRPSFSKSEPPAAERIFQEILTSGGYTEYECAVSAYEHLQSEKDD